MNNLNNSSKLRIVSDYLDFEKNRPEDIYFYMNKKNVFQNYALIIGPKNTPYFGGIFKLDILFEDKDSSYNIFIKKNEEILPWKKFNSNMAISIEYDLKY